MRVVYFKDFAKMNHISAFYVNLAQLFQYRSMAVVGIFMANYTIIYALETSLN